MKSPGFAERFPFSKVLIALLSFFLIIITSSCNSDTSDQKLPSAQEITDTIRSHLEGAGGVPAHEISIDVNEGVVTLSGSTTNLMAKQKTKEIAQSTYGILAVVNNLKVSTTRPDKAVDKDVDAALSTDPATETWQIETEVNNGVVTLKGAVDSWQERKLAATVASRVKGVKQINNNIIVNYQGDRTDKEMQAEIEKSIQMSSRISGNMVKVDVNEGRVELSGAVGSAREKSVAMELAHVTGVESVNVDELEVHPEYESKMFRSDMIETLTASQIKDAINSALRYDPRVPADRITVSVDDETAILRGRVHNLNAKLAAESDARNTAGINTVTNNIAVESKLVVKPEVPTTDKAIAKRVRYAIMRDPYIQATVVKVDVENGVATLNGEVTSQFEKNQAEKIASTVKGIIAINNNLNIQKDAQDV